MFVASAERGGLYANLTRIVELDEPDRELTRRLDACEQILAIDAFHHLVYAAGVAYELIDGRRNGAS